jgi:hypothetical protein
VSTKMAVFWALAPCSLVEVNQRFRGPCRLHHQGDDGGSKDLWKVGKLLPDYTAPKPRRQPSSYSPPWEPQILLRISNVYFLTILIIWCQQQIYCIFVGDSDLQIFWKVTVPLCYFNFNTYNIFMVLTS